MDLIEAQELYARARRLQNVLGVPESVFWTIELLELTMLWTHGISDTACGGFSGASDQAR